jgi:hypothetical protein
LALCGWSRHPRQRKKARFQAGACLFFDLCIKPMVQPRVKPWA